MAVNSAEHYQEALLSLLPKGDAWPTDPDSDLAKLMRGIGEEFARIEARAQDVIKESHPSQTTEMFEEWEAMYGLPNACMGSESSLQEARATLIQKYQQYGGQSREFFIAMAAALGFTITITEFSDFWCGDEVGGAIGDEDWRFVWQINSDQLNERFMECGDSVGDPLRTWGNHLLECVLGHLVHSHRKLIFSYS